MKEKTVKKILSITAIFLMFFVGCSNNESNISGPPTNDNQLSKNRLELTNLISDPLPIKYVITNKEIDGTKGGLLSFEQDALNSEGTVVHVYAEFEVSPGAFVGTQTISMTADVDNGSIYFYPHMNFSQTCYLNYGLSNMNLVNLGFKKSDKKAYFVYIDDSGTIEPIDNMGVSLNFRNGSLKVNSADISHFSRYAFLR
jgi:hypothetical protein